MSEPDEMLGGERHAEAEIGADMVRAALAEASQHLHDRHALSSQQVDGRGPRAFSWRDQDAVDPLLPHAGDEAILPRRRLRRIGDICDPTRPIERLVYACGELGVEWVRDLANDKADRMGKTRSQIGSRAIVHIPK
jgi:hypothetical protein